MPRPKSPYPWVCKVISMQDGRFLPVVENIETTEVEALGEPGTRQETLPLNAGQVGRADAGWNPSRNRPRLGGPPCSSIRARRSRHPQGGLPHRGTLPEHRPGVLT